jgi:hypothetical protein
MSWCDAGTRCRSPSGRSRPSRGNGRLGLACSSSTALPPTARGRPAMSAGARVDRSRAGGLHPGQGAELGDGDDPSRPWWRSSTRTRSRSMTGLWEARGAAPRRWEEVAATFAPAGGPARRRSADEVDYARAFGDRAPVQTRRGAFFSMAASAIRRDVWEALPFDEKLRYSEDCRLDAAGVGARAGACSTCPRRVRALAQLRSSRAPQAALGRGEGGQGDLPAGRARRW